MSEKTTAFKPAGRPRSRSTATIIKAAKEAGATSVTFPDGTIVSLTPASSPTTVANPWDADLRPAE